MSRTTPLTPTSAPTTTVRSADPLPAILIVDSDTTLFRLIEEWLVACDFKVLRQTDEGGPAAAHVGIVILDLPFPRHEISEAVRKITALYPEVPVVALSSTFFPGIPSYGSVARSLGVSAVIAKPLKRDNFVQAVTRLLRPSA